MNKKNKILSSFLLTIVTTFIVGFANVDAYIKESVNAGTPEADLIENGTTIIGVTKFNPSTIVTVKRASIATMNDVSYNIDNPSYDGVHVYYYFHGWYEFDENNNSTPVSDKDKLNELNIFYVDNVEKNLTIPYTGDTSVTFKTDKPNKDRNVSLANGVITVPATVKDLTVLKGNTTVAYYSKANESSMSFLENPTIGKLIMPTGLNEGNLTSFFEDDSLTLQGDIAYTIKKDSQNGNYVTVGLVRDDLPTLEEVDKIKFLVKDANNAEGTEYKWTATDDVMQPLDILFTEDVKSATIEATWEEGNTQTFTVNITDETNLNDVPNGTIDWGEIGAILDEYGDPVAPGFLYDITSQPGHFIVTGDIGYFEGNDELSAGNRVEVLITPNEKYVSAFSIEVDGSCEDDEAEIGWGDFYGETVIKYVPKFTEENRIIKIHVTWEEGFTQTFTLDANAATLQPEPGTGN